MFFNENDRQDVLGEDLANPNALLEAMIYAEASKLPQDERIAFAESEEAQLLVEKSVLNKKTLVRLSKNDAWLARVKMAAFQIAKYRRAS